MTEDNNTPVAGNSQTPAIGDTQTLIGSARPTIDDAQTLTGITQSTISGDAQPQTNSTQTPSSDNTQTQASSTQTPTGTNAQPQAGNAQGPAGGKTQPISEVMDATLAPSVSAPALSTIDVYNQAKSRDGTRSNIAYWLLALLTIVISFAFSLLIVVSCCNTKITFENLKTLLELIMGPLIALVSAATGFYFGSSQSEQNK